MNPEIKSLIFQLIKNKPEITIGELSQVLNISSLEVFEFFQVMKEIEVKFENLGGLNHVEEEIVKILQEKSENPNIKKIGLHELAENLELIGLGKNSLNSLINIVMNLRQKGYSIGFENVASGVYNIWLA